MDEGVIVPGKHCSCGRPVAETYVHSTVTEGRTWARPTGSAWPSCPRCVRGFTGLRVCPRLPNVCGT